jgi:hypothetical protein
MRLNIDRRFAIVLHVVFLGGCAAYQAAAPEPDRIVQDFQRPGPLKNDPNTILLEVSIDKGELRFA